MMMESFDPANPSGAQGHRGAWWLAVAVALLTIAAGLAWFGAQRTAHDARQLAILSELQLAARDVSALSSLAAGGNQGALSQLRDRVASLESMLSVLISGGTHKGEAVSAVAGSPHARLKEFATHWGEFKRRTDALPAAILAPDAQATKDAGQKRSA